MSNMLPAAVAVIGVVGCSAAEVILRFWRPVSRGRQLHENHIRYGTWGGGNAVDGAGEDVVICRVGPESYEIHCHGGAAAQKRILRDLVSAEVQVEVAGVSVQGDRIVAAAFDDMLRAKTINALAMLHHQYSGRLSAEIHRLAVETHTLEIAARLGAVEQLIKNAAVGVRLIEPFRVLLAGPPNVGKSTLLNRLVGWDRAIVDDAAGTTRDPLREDMSLSGWPVAVIDSAGLRDTADPMETAGIQMAIDLAATCDCVCLLVDPNQGWTPWHDHVAKTAAKTLTVATKSDLSHAHAVPSGSVAVSGLSGVGIGQLVEVLLQTLGFNLDLLAAAVPFRIEQVELLREAASTAESDLHFSSSLLQMLGSQNGPVG